MLHSKANTTSVLSGAPIGSDAMNLRTIHNELSGLQNLNRTDKETLQKIASFAQYDSPEVMAELLSMLSDKLDGINNKWVFSAISFSLWTSTLSNAQHFIYGRTTLPISLLDKLVSAANKVHTGIGSDWDTLYLSLTAINACVSVIQSADIGDIESQIYSNTVTFLDKIKETKDIPPTLIFLAEQTLEQLTYLNSEEDKSPSKSSLKNETGKAFFNIGISALYLGSGITSLVVATGATAATAGATSPIMAASAFSFALLVGLSSERAFAGFKNLKAIKGKIGERNYFDKLQEIIGFTGLEAPITQLSLSFESVIPNVVKLIDMRGVSHLKLKQVLFSLFQILRYVLPEKTNIQVIFNIIKAIYVKHTGDLKNRGSVGAFLLEQVQQLRDSRYFKEEDNKLAITEFITELTQSSPQTQRQQIGQYFNSQLNIDSNNYYEIDFTVEQVTSPTNYPVETYDVPLLNTGTYNRQIQASRLEDYQLMLTGLASQRSINQVLLSNNDNVVTNCNIIPATPNGDCGFIAISRYLQLINKLTYIGNTPLTRDLFIKKVADVSNNAATSDYEHELIEKIIEEDKATSLDDWKTKFSSTAIYVGEPHLRFIAYFYSLSFEIFALDDNSNQFKPELSNEIIKPAHYPRLDVSIITVYLAHIVAGERSESHYLNHFEGIIINPSEVQQEIIKVWLDETTNATKKIVQMTNQRLRPTHVVPKINVDDQESIITDFKDLRQSRYGMVDKTSFIADFWNQEAGFSLLRPRRFGKSMTLSMCDYFFSIRHKNISEKLFGDLNIAACYPNFYHEHRGRYPVIMIDLKDIAGNGYEDTLGNFCRGVTNKCYREHRDTLESSSVLNIDEQRLAKKYYFGEAQKFSEGELSETILILSELLHKHHGKKVIILVDEYDSPLIKAKQSKDFLDYNKLKIFIGNFFSKTFKNNPHVEKFFFTGIMDAKGTGIFSDLNTTKTFTLINDPIFSPYLGFSEKEVIDYLEQNGLSTKSETLEGLKDYYNGYVCLSGNDAEISSDLFNIFSITQYVASNGILASYWINSSSSHQLFVDLILGTNNSELMQQVLNLMGDYPVIDYCQSQPDSQEPRERGIYFYKKMVDGELELHALVVHQKNNLANNHEHIQIPINKIQDKIIKKIDRAIQSDLMIDLSFDEHKILVDFIKELCQDPAKTLGFRVETQLTLQNLKFLDSIDGNEAKDIYGLLFYAGYLTFTGKYTKNKDAKLFELKIPNTEIRQMFNNEIRPKVYEQYRVLAKKREIDIKKQQSLCLVRSAKAKTNECFALSINYKQTWMNKKYASKLSAKIEKSYALYQIEDTLRYNKQGCIEYIEFESIDEELVNQLIAELNQFANQLRLKYESTESKITITGSSVFFSPINPVTSQFEELSLSEIEKSAMGLDTPLNYSVFISHCELVQKIISGEKVSPLSLKQSFSYFTLIKEEVSSELSESVIEKIDQFIHSLDEAINLQDLNEHRP